MLKSVRPKILVFLASFFKPLIKVLDFYTGLVQYYILILNIHNLKKGE